MKIPKILVSVHSLDEAYEAYIGGCDIIDIKDSSIGSLGTPKPKIVKEIVSKFKNLCELSIALGDIKYYTPTLRFTFYTASQFNVNYIKIGLESNNLYEIEKILNEVVENIENYKDKVILVSYADYMKINSIEPIKVIDLAYKYNFKGVMIDTRLKNGLSIFNYLTIDYLRKFLGKAKDCNLLTAIAGSLKIEHIEKVLELENVNVIGFRTAVCEGGRNGMVKAYKVKEIKEKLRKLYLKHHENINTKVEI